MALLETGMRPGVPLRGGRSLPLRLLGDERLAALAASGNGAAFGAIYERHSRALTRYCQSILLHQEDARDALQEAMVKAMRALRTGAAPDSLRPWLFRIAHNEAISLLRRRRPHAGLEAAEAVPAVADGAVRERLAELVGDLHALPERQRCALLLRELCGLRYGEIATVLETNEVAARRLVADGRVGLHRFDEGRALDCADVRRTLATGDGRSRRARSLRAHVRDCAGCSDFAAAVARRRLDLRLLAPPLPGLGLLGLLSGGAATGSGMAIGTGIVATQSIKTATAAVLVAMAGAGAVGNVTGHESRDRPAVPRERAVQVVAPSDQRTSVAAPKARRAGVLAAPRVRPASPRTAAKGPAGRAQPDAARARAEMRSANLVRAQQRIQAAVPRAPKPAVEEPAAAATPAPTVAPTATPAPQAVTTAASRWPSGGDRAAAGDPVRQYLDQVRDQVNQQLQTSMTNAQQQLNAAMQGTQQATTAAQQWVQLVLGGGR